MKDYASISLWKEGVLLFVFSSLLASLKYTQIHHLKETSLSLGIDWCDLLGIEINCLPTLLGMDSSNDSLRNSLSPRVYILGISSASLPLLFKWEKSIKKIHNSLPLQSNTEMKPHFAASTCKPASLVFRTLDKEASIVWNGKPLLKCCSLMQILGMRERKVISTVVTPVKYLFCR